MDLTRSDRIVGDNGMDVEEGQPGEILVKGPVVTKGYHDTPEASAAAFKYGWFCTGDIAIWRNGLLYIVDRKKVCRTVYQPSELTQYHRSLSSTKVCKLRLQNWRLSSLYIHQYQMLQS